MASTSTIPNIGKVEMSWVTTPSAPSSATTATTPAGGLGKDVDMAGDEAGATANGNGHRDQDLDVADDDDDRWLAVT